MSLINKGLAVLALLCASAADAETIVLRASGPSAAAYPVGKVLKDNSKVTLKAGDLLVLLDGRGTRTLTGPFTAVIGLTEPTRSLTALDRFMGNASLGRSSTGAIRGGPGGRSAGMWEVDVARSGPFCAPDVENVTLFRSDAAKPVKYAITGPNGGKPVKVSFAVRQSTVVWPVVAMPIIPGASYTLLRDGTKSASTVSFAVIPMPGPNIGTTIAVLAANKCEGQITLLNETLSVE